MAVLQNVPCGGVLLDDAVFAVNNGVITLADKEADEITTTVTMCSLEFDGAYFQIVGSPYQFILTSAARDTEVEKEAKITTFTANCGGLRLDAEYFELDENLVVTGDLDKITGKKPEPPKEPDEPAVMTRAARKKTEPVVEETNDGDIVNDEE